LFPSTSDVSRRVDGLARALVVKRGRGRVGGPGNFMVNSLRW
jgi:hypothetical protein